jgi:hypothetical protein
MNRHPLTKEFVAKVTKNAGEKARLEFQLNGVDLTADQYQLVEAGIILGAAEAMQLLMNYFDEGKL